MLLPSCIILYGSTTGNTQTIAEAIFDHLLAAGADVALRNVADADPEEMLAFDLVLLGSSTWGAGELQDDMFGFAQGMAALDLHGVQAACFGAGDSSFGNEFCRAVSILEATLRHCGAELIEPPLRVDGEVEPYLDDVAAWTDRLVAKAAVA